MRYAIVAIVETKMLPKRLLGELCSALEFDRAKTNTTVETVVVLTDNGRSVAHYDRRDRTRSRSSGS